jgi:hypothetical protein
VHLRCPLNFFIVVSIYWKPASYRSSLDLASFGKTTNRSDAKCRGQPWGSPKTTRGIPLKTCKKPKQSTSHLSTHPRHGPHRGGPRSPAEWPSQRLPRAGSASLEGLHLPRAGSASLEGSGLLRAGSASFEDLSPPRSRPSSRARPPPHARTDIKCSDAAGRRHHAPGTHAPALLRQLPRGSHPRYCGGLCDTAGVSPVTLRRLLLYG